MWSNVFGVCFAFKCFGSQLYTREKKTTHTERERETIVSHQSQFGSADLPLKLLCLNVFWIVLFYTLWACVCFFAHPTPFHALNCNWSLFFSFVLISGHGNVVKLQFGIFFTFYSTQPAALSFPEIRIYRKICEVHGFFLYILRLLLSKYFCVFVFRELQ